MWQNLILSVCRYLPGKTHSMTRLLAVDKGYPDEQPPHQRITSQLIVLSHSPTKEFAYETLPLRFEPLESNFVGTEHFAPLP